jgi:hypothetical protein
MRVIWLSVAVFFFGICACAQTASQTATVLPAANQASDMTNQMAKVLELELLARLCSVTPANPKCEGRRIGAEMAALYVEITKTKDGTERLAGRAMETSDLGKLQLILIAQNQRIIDLLQQLTIKK